MAVDQGIADAKGKLGAVYRYKPEDLKAQEEARIELAAATLFRDIKKALDSGVTPAHKRQAMKLLNGKA